MSDLADKMCVDQANLTASLKGNPTLSRLQDVAKVLGVEIQELFAKKEEGSENVRGFIETGGKVFSVKDEEGLLEAVASVPGMIAIPLYKDLSALRDKIRSFIHTSIEADAPECSMFGQTGRFETFCLSSIQDNVITAEGGELLENRIFILSLLRKGETFTYELCEYGSDGEYDLDGSLGLAQMIINDVEWMFESSESAGE